MNYRKITGTRGTWHATVTWADRTKNVLPVVHAHFAKCTDNGFVYRCEHPDLVENANAKAAKFFEMVLATRRVIMTTDNINEEGTFERTGYVGVFDVDEIEIDRERGVLAFTFVARHN